LPISIAKDLINFDFIKSSFKIKNILTLFIYVVKLIDVTNKKSRGSAFNIYTL